MAMHYNDCGVAGGMPHDEELCKQKEEEERLHPQVDLYDLSTYTEAEKVLTALASAIAQRNRALNALNEKKNELREITRRMRVEIEELEVRVDQLNLGIQGFISG